MSSILSFLDNWIEANGTIGASDDDKLSQFMFDTEVGKILNDGFIREQI